MAYVLDASALLAFLLEEDRVEQIRHTLVSGVIGSVNLAETVTVLTRRGFDADQVRTSLDNMLIPVLIADATLAIEAGLLWPKTKRAGSSLGDRYALALSRHLDATLVTSDRGLIHIAPQVGVSVLPF